MYSSSARIRPEAFMEVHSWLGKGISWIHRAVIMQRLQGRAEEHQGLLKLSRALGRWQGLKEGGISSRGMAYTCRQVSTGWGSTQHGTWRPSGHTNPFHGAGQHKGAAVQILKVTFVLAAFLVPRGGKAKDLRLSLGGSCFNLKACSCLRTACFCFVSFFLLVEILSIYYDNF